MLFSFFVIRFYWYLFELNREGDIESFPNTIILRCLG